MPDPTPRLTIGLPVYNGAQFIAEAIDSILAQTYKDFQLVISDNASTDDTESICRPYAAKDPRVRYIRNETNVGAVRNYNRLFEDSRSVYFKWAAHDDALTPDYLERCVAVLDSQPSVAVCHTETIYIDEHGRPCESHDDCLHLCSPRPHKRYHDYLFRPYPRCNAIFGVIRASQLRETPLFGLYMDSDRVLLGELALRGEIYRVPEPLFLRRDYPQQAWRVCSSRKAYEAWFDPARGRRITFPHWRLLWEHFRTVMRVPMSGYERVLGLGQLGRWIRMHDGRLVRELLLRER